MNGLTLLTVFFQVTLLAAVGLAAARPWRSAALRHGVLLATLLCLLAAPGVSLLVDAAGFSVDIAPTFPLFAPRPPAPARPAPTRLPHSSPDAQALPEKKDAQEGSGQPNDNRLAAAGENPSFTEEEEEPGSAAGTSSWSLATLLATVWLAGTVFLLWGLARSQLQIDRLVRAARPAEGGLVAEVAAQARRALKTTGPLRVALSGRVAGPMVAGTLRPLVLIPARYLETLTREELLQVLIHEGAHAMRRDLLVVMLQRLCGALYWWHPLVFLVLRELTRSREEICDNFVLGSTEPEVYGATLLRLAALSPAMARFSLATGIFDGKGTLEIRIRALLDDRRVVATRLPLITGMAILGAFTLLALLVGASRAVPNAQTPPVETLPSPALWEQRQIDQPVEARALRLFLTYRGGSDKPFYDLLLSVPPVAQQLRPFTFFHPIDEVQGAKILNHLKQSRFFEHAAASGAAGPDAPDGYTLRVAFNNASFEEPLGWDPGTIQRLDALRGSLEGDAAQSMDRLLARLEGMRRSWETGDVVNDLKATLSQPPRTRPFGLGEPIPLKLELTNGGKEDRSYPAHSFIQSGLDLVVFDDLGRRVPYVRGPAGLLETQASIRAGESRVIEDGDLSSFYYLRRPGRYSVVFRAQGLPSSNTVHFQVSGERDLAQDGDPMGKLFPLATGTRRLWGSPNLSAKIRPGRNRAEAPGWSFVFPLTDRGVKGSKAVVWLWLTNDPVQLATPPANDLSLSSEYLGKIARWHAYLHVPPEAMQVWPTVKRDLADALEGKPMIPRSAGGPPSDDDYRSYHDRFRSLILAAAKASRKKEVEELTEKFNDSLGGKLLYVQVTRRMGPPAQHEVVFSKFLDPSRKIAIGKIHFAISDRPIVSRDHEDQEMVLVTTNPLGENRWPEDLQVTLAIDEASASRTAAYEKMIDGVVKQLSADEMWTNGLTPHIALTGDAKPEVVIAEAVKKYASGGEGKPYRILHVKTVMFLPPKNPVFAALIQSAAGTRVLIFYAFSGDNAWWSRFYEVKLVGPTSASAGAG